MTKIKSFNCSGIELTMYATNKSYVLTQLGKSESGELHLSKLYFFDLTICEGVWADLINNCNQAA